MYKFVADGEFETLDLMMAAHPWALWHQATAGGFMLFQSQLAFSRWMFRDPSL